MTRVLFLAERVALGAPNGAAAHAASSFAALQASFDVLPLTATGSGGTPSRLRPVRGLVPQRVRGARQDLLARRTSVAFRSRAEPMADSFRPDVVYERSEYLVTTGAALARRLGVPLVLEVNGLVERDVRTMYRSPFEPLGASVERWKLSRAAAIVVESQGMADALVARGVATDRLAIVPNAVSPDRVRPEPRLPNPERAVIGWMGHLMSWHVDALRFLIDASPELVAADPRIRFAIFGGGPAVDDLAAAAPDWFDFHGVLPPDALARALEEVDIAVIPDVPPHKLPVKAIEFGAAGLPLVAPGSASFDRQLEPFVEYQPFERLDRNSFREALLAVVGDLELRTRLAAALHAAVRDRFTWEANAPRLRDVVERVLAQR